MDNEQIYSAVENEIQLQELLNGTQEATPVDYAIGYLNFCNKAKVIAPLLIAGSILIGIILLKIFKKDGGIRRAAVFSCIIGFPLFVLFAVYIICYIYGMLF